MQRMMIENRLNAEFLMAFILFCSMPVCATTEYSRLEIHSELRIFEKYLKILEETQDSMGFKKIDLTDERWKKASEKEFNAISSASYAADGSILLESQGLKLQIIFTPKYSANTIDWTCEIKKKDNLMFHPPECRSWVGVIRVK